MIISTNDLPAEQFERLGYYYDQAAADHVCEFFERFLVHTKGEYAGKPFVLERWQRDDIVGPLFGWKRPDGRRRFRSGYVEIPRKNGKSALCSGLALYLLLADGERGAEVYSAAGDRFQASRVFDQAKEFVDLSPELSKRAKRYKYSIVAPDSKSTYHVLSAEAYTKHGLNASGIIFDELHTQPDRDLFDVLDTSTGARAQPIMVMVTTAGTDRFSICYEQREHARQVINGTIDDPSFFAYMAYADESEDWTEPATWIGCNPNYGVSISDEYLADKCKKALSQPSYQNTFRRLHLNQWTSAASRWLDLSDWDACQDDEPALVGRACFGGLDLASTTDVAAFVLCFPPTADDDRYWLKPYFWIPQENIVARSRADRVPYEAWERDGLVYATPGNVIDYTYIRAHIRRLAERFDIREVAYDRYGAEQLRQDLDDDGINLVQFGQSFGWMSAPSKEFERLVLSKRIAHGGSPPLRWMVDNTVVKTSVEGDIKPDKEKSREKIDGVVASIMALDRTSRGGDPVSVYASRGVRTL